MDFKELQDAVLTDGFAESDRGSVKNWINTRLGQIWDMNEWTFTYGAENVTVTANSNLITALPDDFVIAIDVFRSTGETLEGIEEYRTFARRYLGTANASAAIPEAYSVIGGQMFVGPTSSETDDSYLLIYEKAPTLLVNDTDVPAIPEQYHQTLVYGGKAEGFTSKVVLLADSFEALYQQGITAMTRKYLSAVRGSAHQTPAYRPGSGRPWS